jgi:hypothetical protein
VLHRLLFPVRMTILVSYTYKMQIYTSEVLSTEVTAQDSVLDSNSDGQSSES